MFVSLLESDDGCGALLVGIVPVVRHELRALLYGDYVAEIVLLLDAYVVCEQAVVADEGFKAVAPECQFLGSLKCKHIGTRLKYSKPADKLG